MVEDFDGVWKGLTALAGIYLLFIIEHCIGMFKHYKDHRVRGEAARRRLGRHGSVWRVLTSRCCFTGHEEGERGGQDRQEAVRSQVEPALGRGVAAPEAPRGR